MRVQCCFVFQIIALRGGGLILVLFFNIWLFLSSFWGHLLLFFCLTVCAALLVFSSMFLFFEQFSGCTMFGGMIFLVSSASSSKYCCHSLDSGFLPMKEWCFGGCAVASGSISSSPLIPQILGTSRQCPAIVVFGGSILFCLILDVFSGCFLCLIFSLLSCSNGSSIGRVHDDSPSLFIYLSLSLSVSLSLSLYISLRLSLYISLYIYICMPESY